MLPLFNNENEFLLDHLYVSRSQLLRINLLNMPTTLYPSFLAFTHKAIFRGISNIDLKEIAHYPATTEWVTLEGPSLPVLSRMQSTQVIQIILQIFLAMCPCNYQRRKAERGEKENQGKKHQLFKILNPFF